MDPLTKKVFERIDSEHLTPRPRWEFLFKNYTLWALGSLAIVLGALAVSATLFQLQNVDWRLGSATHADFLSFFFAAAPLMWVAALALFILIGYINIHRTTHGYRYPLTVIVLGMVFLSLAFGGGLYYMGFGSAVDEVIGDHPPFYRPIILQERSWWTAPEKGLLTGKVVSVTPSVSSFTLQDFNGREWKVDTDDLRARDMTLVARGGAVRVVGLPVATTSSRFHACFVFPGETRGVNKKEPLPSPLTVVASTSGSVKERSNECKGIRPYADLHAIEDNF